MFGSLLSLFCLAIMGFVGYSVATGDPDAAPPTTTVPLTTTSTTTEADTTVAVTETSIEPPPTTTPTETTISPPVVPIRPFGPGGLQRLAAGLRERTGNDDPRLFQMVLGDRHATFMVVAGGRQRVWVWTRLGDDPDGMWSASEPREHPAGVPTWRLSAIDLGAANRLNRQGNRQPLPGSQTSTMVVFVLGQPDRPEPTWLVNVSGDGGQSWQLRAGPKGNVYQVLK